MVLLQPSVLFQCHQLSAALFLHSLAHTCLFRARECWWNSFTLFSLLLLLCSDVLCFSSFPHFSYLLFCQWFGFCSAAVPISLVGYTLQLSPLFCCQTNFETCFSAEDSLVHLSLSCSQMSVLYCIQSSTSSSGTCFSPSPAQSPAWSIVPVLRQSDPASPGAFEHSTSVELRLLAL